MTASRLDELTVHDFDDAADYTVDIRSGAETCDDDRPVRLARGTDPQQPMVDPSSPLMRVMLCTACRGERFIASYSPVPGVSGGFTSAEEPCRACEDHTPCAVQLHEALTSLLELEALITRNGGHLFPPDQHALFAARELLRKHGRR